MATTNELVRLIKDVVDEEKPSIPTIIDVVFNLVSETVPTKTLIEVFAAFGYPASDPLVVGAIESYRSLKAITPTKTPEAPVSVLAKNPAFREIPTSDFLVWVASTRTGIVSASALARRAALKALRNAVIGKGSGFGLTVDLDAKATRELRASGLLGPNQSLASQHPSFKQVDVIKSLGKKVLDTRSSTTRALLTSLADAERARSSAALGANLKPRHLKIPGTDYGISGPRQIRSNIFTNGGARGISYSKQSVSPQLRTNTLTGIPKLELFAKPDFLGRTSLQKLRTLNEMTSKVRRGGFNDSVDFKGNRLRELSRGDQLSLTERLEKKLLQRFLDPQRMQRALGRRSAVGQLNTLRALGGIALATSAGIEAARLREEGSGRGLVPGLAEQILRTARMMCPQDTGTLAGSLYTSIEYGSFSSVGSVEIIWTGGGNIDGSVVVGATTDTGMRGIAKIHVRSDIGYGFYLENGTTRMGAQPFLRPALGRLYSSTGANGLVVSNNPAYGSLTQVKAVRFNTTQRADNGRTSISLSNPQPLLASQRRAA